MADVRVLDELAANATTAGMVEVVGGWRLRAAPELPFSRANSVVPVCRLGIGAGDHGTDRDGRALLSRSRGAGALPAESVCRPRRPRCPSGGAGLHDRYPVDIYVATAARVLAQPPRAESPVARVVDAIDTDWIAAFGENATALRRVRTPTRDDRSSVVRPQ